MSSRSSGSSGSSGSRRRQLSIISPVAYSSSSCGYCTPPASGQRSKAKTSKSYGIWAHSLSPYHYQRLIDLGWRRSGNYIYKPDNSRNCCQQIPIRLPLQSFRPSKAHRRALNGLLFQVRTTKPKPAKWKGKWSRQREWDIVARWDEIETLSSSTAQTNHPDPSSPWADKVAGPKTKKLQLKLSLASSTDEKYQLFRKYQATIHGESESDISSKNGWERFLVDTNMQPTWPSSGTPLTSSETSNWQRHTVDPKDPRQEIPYGCYHHEYRLDGKLVAVGVLDILPSCVSSVYVFYDPDYNDLQIGKISALREIALGIQISKKKGMQDVQFYYLGYYIHTCQKMKYKAEYKPAELLDCATNKWFGFASIKSSLDQGTRYNFAQASLMGASKPLSQSSTSASDVHRSTRLQAEHDDDEDGDEKDYDDEDTDALIPCCPSPPPGMMDSAQLITSIRGNDSKGEQVLSQVLTLEAARQHEGIKPLFMATFTREFFSTGDSEEFKQAIDCIAALNDPTLMTQCVLFI